MNKEEKIKQLYKEGKIKKLNNNCYSVPSELFVFRHNSKNGKRGFKMIKEINKNWSKSVYFSMIADSRFNKDIKKEIERLHNGVLEVLKDKDRFKIYFSNYDFMTFEDGKTEQIRVYYRVEINKKNTRLNDLYYFVNSIKPVYYGKKWGN